MAKCATCGRKYWVEDYEMTTNLFCSNNCERINQQQIERYLTDKEAEREKRKINKPRRKRMSLIKVHKKLLKIKKTSGTNDKILLLTKYLKNKTFLRVIQYMYNDNKHYGIKKLPNFGTDRKNTSSKDIFAFLDKLAKQRGTSDADKIHLAKLASIDLETHAIVQMICKKDASSGFAGKTINKARPDTVFIMPYMRCSTEKKKKNINYPCYGQEKADGMFDNLIISNNIIFKTRNGKLINQLEHIQKHIKKHRKGKFNKTVLHGELRVRINGKVLDRQTGNGILNQCVQNTASPSDAKCVFLSLWDAIPEKDFWNEYCDINYSKRLKKTKRFIKRMNNKKLINLIKTEKVKSEKEAKAFYKKRRKEGCEGAILKNLNGKWKFHDSPNMVKMKNVSECELRIIGWNYGDGKNKNRMGALKCASECGKLKVNIGGGFSDKLRDINWDEELGSIISAEFESVIKSKNKELYSLYLPEYVEIRSDKNWADNLEQIIEQAKKKKKK